jgi:hypothetical protein
LNLEDTTFSVSTACCLVGVCGIGEEDLSEAFLTPGCAPRVLDQRVVGSVASDDNGVIRCRAEWVTVDTVGVRLKGSARLDGSGPRSTGNHGLEVGLGDNRIDF